MTPVGTDPMTPACRSTPVAWGTRLDMTCSYPPFRGDYEGGSYALVVHTLHGGTEQVATWNGLPGKTMHLTAATASQKAQNGGPSTWVTPTDVIWAFCEAVAAVRCMVLPGRPFHEATRSVPPSRVCTTRA